jgi:pimeloyl-ACP methyl ester carboxylesterase
MTLLFAATYPERTAAAILYGTGASWVRADDYPWAPTPEEWQQAIDEDLDSFGSPE